MCFQITLKNNIKILFIMFLHFLQMDDIFYTSVSLGPIVMDGILSERTIEWKVIRIFVRVERKF